VKIIPLKLDVMIESADGERFYVTAEYDQEFHMWSAGIALTMSPGAQSSETAVRALAKKAREFADAVDADQESK
jgi:hypothetical protein